MIQKYVLLFSLLALSTSELLSQPAMPTCAVLPFKDESGFDNKNWDIATGIPKVLADSLARSGKWRVIELPVIIEFFKDRKIQSSQLDNLEVLKRISIGLKTDYLIVGQINKFGLSRVNVGSFLLGGYETYKAEMDISVFVFNHHDSTRTEEFVCSSEIRRKDLGFKLIGKPSEQYLNFDELDKLEFNSPELNQTIIGEALTELVGDFVGKLAEVVPIESDGTIKNTDAANESYSEATIVFVRADEVYLNVGAAEKIAVGEILSVYTRGEPITDPDSAKLIGYADRLIGKIKIILVKDNHLSVARIVEQYEPIKVKDKVRVRKK